MNRGGGGTYRKVAGRDTQPLILKRNEHTASCQSVRWSSSEGGKFNNSAHPNLGSASNSGVQ